MNRIEKLIQELCPNGVEFHALDELVEYEQPTKYLVKSTDYSDAFETAVLTPGQSFILGYTDEAAGIYPASKDHPVILFDDFTTAFKWVNFPFKVKSSAVKLLTARSAIADLRYIFYAMSVINFEPRDHSRQWIRTFGKFRVPLPPIEVQREIVKILDLFTELEAELEARRKQYEYYRDQLLTFPEDGGRPGLSLVTWCLMPIRRSRFQS